MIHHAIDQACQAKTFKLDPIDKHILEQTGSLPGLDLLINPELLARIREAPPSVHTIETKDRTHAYRVKRIDPDESEQIEHDSDRREDYTFRGYLLRPRMDAYVRAVEIYSTIDHGFGGKFSSRLTNCRKHAWFVQHKVTKKLRVMSSRCKLRWCPICRDVSRMIVTTAVDEWLQIQKYPKMITLTLKHNDDPLQLQIKRLYDCFRKLRRRAYFQRLITGGVWFFQLKLNLQTEQWHPHIHCLVAGKFLPHTRLKSLWKEITSDSNIVDIRPVKDLENASTEVARYATSPADITRMSLEQSLEVYYATKGRRICGSWGSAKSITLKPTPQTDQDDWCKVADFYFINVQKQYSKTAMNFWKCYRKDQPYDGPRVQDERDVFEDELKILMSVEDMPETYQQFAQRVLRNRSGPWANFFKDQ
ncbi:hypothetical protein ES703_93124 [subsurface metagenome]